jgi:hypothetical protein
VGEAAIGVGVGVPLSSGPIHKNNFKSSSGGVSLPVSKPSGPLAQKYPGSLSPICKYRTPFTITTLYNSSPVSISLSGPAQMMKPIGSPF